MSHVAIERDLWNKSERQRAGLAAETQMRGGSAACIHFPELMRGARGHGRVGKQVTGGRGRQSVEVKA